MSEQPHSLRAQIIKLVHDQIEFYYGTESETPIIRAFHIGPYNASLLDQTLCLTDAGAERREPDVDQVFPAKALKIAMALKLPAKWDRPDSLRQWQHLVEGIEVILANLPNLGAGLGITDASLIADEPLEVMLQSGPTTNIWALEAEIIFAASWSMPEANEENGGEENG